VAHKQKGSAFHTIPPPSGLLILLSAGIRFDDFDKPVQMQMQTCSFNTRGSRLSAPGSAEILSRGSPALHARARAFPPFLPLSYTSAQIVIPTGTVMRLTRFARLKLFSSLSRDTALSETRASFARNYFRIRGSYRVTRRRISSFVTSRLGEFTAAIYRAALPPDYRVNPRQLTDRQSPGN